MNACCPACGQTLPQARPHEWSGRLLVDTTRARYLRTPDGTRGEKVSPMEHRLLTCLIERGGMAVPRVALMDALWPIESANAPDTLDEALRVHVRNLRAKLMLSGWGEGIEAIFNLPRHGMYGLNTLYLEQIWLEAQANLYG